MRSLLGMAQYSAQFIPNFSELTAPLRERTKANSLWKGGEEQEEAFCNSINSLASDQPGNRVYSRCMSQWSGIDHETKVETKLATSVLPEQKLKPTQRIHTRSSTKKVLRLDGRVKDVITTLSEAQSSPFSQTINH